MAAYADSRPERFLDVIAKAETLRILRAEASEAPALLADFFRDHRSDVDIAFRALGEINRLPGHDDSWPGFDELAQLTLIDVQFNPAYLKLCEAVLSTFLLPIAIRERRLRNKSIGPISLFQRVEEASRTSLDKPLQAFDRVLRNAIAHGGVTYQSHNIVYEDTKESRVCAQSTLRRGSTPSSISATVCPQRIAYSSCLRSDSSWAIP